MDTLARDLRRDERTGRAQYDQVLKREAILTPRSPRRAHEAHIDQSSDRAPGQGQYALDVSYAVGLRLHPVMILPFAGLRAWLRGARLRRLFDALRGLARTELGR